MSMKSFLLLPILALAFQPGAAQAEANAQTPDAKPIASSTAPTAVAKPDEKPAVAPSVPAKPAVTSPAPVSQAAKPAVSAPVPVSPAAEPVAPLLPDVSGTADALTAPLSGTADAAGDSVVAEEVGESGQLTPKTEVPDLAKLDSETLATLAGGVDRDAPELFFDPVAKQILTEAAAGAWRVPVDALYYELAKRTLNDNKDKAARQSFALALFKDADRAKFAKDLAYDDKLADAVIAQIEAGKPKARMELQGLAEKGNRKARLYLGMDKPVAREDAGSTGLTASSPTAATTAPAAPAAASPTAASPTAPKASSPTAVSAPAPTASSPTAAPNTAPKAVEMPKK